MDFTEYLREKAHIEKDKIPCFLHWIGLFRDRNNSMDKFSELLEPYPDWQRRQALRAVNLYRLFHSNTQDTDYLRQTFKQLEQDIKTQMRLQGFSYRSEKSYLNWSRRYYDYCVNQKNALNEKESVKAFLSSLSTDHGVSKSTQDQAFNALLFLFRNIMHRPIEDLAGIIRAPRKKNLPEVLSDRRYCIFLEGCLPASI